MSTITRLPPIYAVIDPVVAPLVIALRRDGFPTSHSCDGHVITDGKPWVTVEIAAGVEPLEAQRRLAQWCHDHGVEALVGIMFGIFGRVHGRTVFYLRLEVFSDLAEARLDG